MENQDQQDKQHPALIGIGALFGKSFSLWGKHFFHFMGINAIFIAGAVPFIYALALPKTAVFFADLPALGRAFFLLENAVFQIALFVILSAYIYTVKENNTVFRSIGNAFKQIWILALLFLFTAAVTGLSHFASVFSAWVPSLEGLFGLLSVGTWVLMVAASIYFGWVIFVCIGDREQNILQGIRKSYGYVRGRWWGVFGRCFAMFILLLPLFLLVFFISIPLSLFLGLTFGFKGVALAIAISALLFALIMTWAFCYTYILYESLKHSAVPQEEKEMPILFWVAVLIGAVTLLAGAVPFFQGKLVEDAEQGVFTKQIVEKSEGETPGLSDVFDTPKPVPLTVGNEPVLEETF